ncbi:GNAT family N-acetyltransferase [Algirhabdus cladophorae]|uniref:GNAT family N-acetyltransferase n=1 Tax=Algirhabdus cladophorae TaxID=3377108 RepID=UPI003B84A0A7
MTADLLDFRTELASSQDDLLAAQALRYEVFVSELGADGSMVDHDRKIEQDRYDDHCDHLLLREAGTNRVVGVYRLMSQNAADRAGGFYSASEFDLSPLERSGKKLLELGRSCVHRDYRGGTAMLHLWSALAGYIDSRGIDILFGVASFHGTDLDALSGPLSLLHHNHLAPTDLRPKAIGPTAVPMGRFDAHSLDRKAAMLAVPQLIKAYLRLGGSVGEGAFVDHAFNTTDVCLVLDIAKMSPKQRKIYTRPTAANNASRL